MPSTDTNIEVLINTGPTGNRAKGRTHAGVDYSF